MILLSAVWNYDTTVVKDDGELIRVKRTESVSRGKVRDLGHIIAS